MKSKLIFLFIFIILTSFASVAVEIDRADITFCVNDGIISSDDSADYLVLDIDGDNETWIRERGHVYKGNDPGYGDYITVIETSADPLFEKAAGKYMASGISMYFYSIKLGDTSKPQGTFIGVETPAGTHDDSYHFVWRTSTQRFFAYNDGQGAVDYVPILSGSSGDWFNFTIVMNHSSGIYDVYGWNGTDWHLGIDEMGQRGTASPSGFVRIWIAAGLTISVDNMRWFNVSDGDYSCPEAPPDITPPVNSSWNVTSDNTFSEDSTAWNSDGVINISSDGLTITVTTDEPSNGSCAIGLNYNHTLMIATNPNYKFATTDAILHAYAVYDNISAGSHCLYCSFIDPSGNEHTNSSSGCLNVTGWQSVNVTLNRPLNDSTLTYFSVEFAAVVEGSNDIINASLWTNLSGVWALNQTFTSVTSNAEINFSALDFPVGFYVWNVESYNAKFRNFSASNFTFRVIVLDVADTGGGSSPLGDLDPDSLLALAAVGEISVFSYIGFVIGLYVWESFFFFMFVVVAVMYVRSFYAI